MTIQERLAKFSSKEMPGYFPPERIMLNNSRIDLFPCHHRLDEVEADIFESYERTIADSDIVLIEAPPHCLGIIDENGKVPETYLETLCSTLENYELQPGTTIESIKKNIKSAYEGPVGNFFVKLEELAEQNERPILFIDPYDVSDIEGSINQNVADKAIEKRLVQIAALFAALNGGNLLFSALQSIYKRRLITKTWSRRDVLSGLLAVTGSVLAAATFNRKRDTILSIIQSGGKDYAMGGRGAGILPQFVFDFIDFRDAGIAYGLDSLTNDSSKTLKIAGFYGAAHVPGIRFYCDHPQERDLRLQAYQPLFGSIGPEKIKIFNFDKNTDSWQRQNLTK